MVPRAGTSRRVLECFRRLMVVGLLKWSWWMLWSGVPSTGRYCRLLTPLLVTMLAASAHLGLPCSISLCRSVLCCNPTNPHFRTQALIRWITKKKSTYRIWFDTHREIWLIFCESFGVISFVTFSFHRSIVMFMEASSSISSRVIGM